jgi:hypothetical protein
MPCVALGSGVATLPWNQWQLCHGIDGNFYRESVATLVWNRWQLSRGIRNWVSPSHQHRLADKIEEKWTIRGLARELGVASGWVYNRIRNGFLSELDVSRKPPHGNVLIRDDAALLARLHAEVKRSRRLRRNARTASIPPDAGDSNAANCAMTSRTNRTLKGAKSDI